MGLKYYFLSDAHLGSFIEGTDVREDKLIRFCARIAGAEGLFLMGDIFDFWFEYRQVVPSAHFGVLHALRKLAATGTAIHYIAGNHDFWKGGFLTDNIGMEVVFGQAVYKLSGYQVRLCHGDGFLPDDGLYRFYRKIVRSPVAAFFYKLVHPDLGIPFAKWVSRKSRRMSDKYAIREEIRDKYRRAALEALNQGSEDVLILGHTHFADRAEQDNRQYFNTGNWMHDFDYLMLEDGKFTSHQFKGGNE